MLSKTIDFKNIFFWFFKKKTFKLTGPVGQHASSFDSFVVQNNGLQKQILFGFFEKKTSKLPNRATAIQQYSFYKNMTNVQTNYHLFFRRRDLTKARKCCFNNTNKNKTRSKLILKIVHSGYAASLGIQVSKNRYETAKSMKVNQQFGPLTNKRPTHIYVFYLKCLKVGRGGYCHLD